MGNERERQLQTKILKVKEEMKVGREEVSIIIVLSMKQYLTEKSLKCIVWGILDV